METNNTNHRMSFLIKGADVNALQQMINDFAVLTGFDISLLDTRGQVILQSVREENIGETAVRKNHRCIPAEAGRDSLISELKRTKVPLLKLCPGGGHFIVNPIRVGGNLLGSLLLSHFRLITHRPGKQGPLKAEAGLDAQRAKKIICLLTDTFSHAIVEHIERIQGVQKEDEHQTAVEGQNHSWMMSSEPISEVSAIEALIRLEQSQWALKASEERYRTLVGNIPAIVYRCEIAPPWHMYYISEYVMNVTGYAPADFYKGGKMVYSDLVHKDDMQLVVETIQNSLADERHYEIEYRILDVHGAIHWVFERGRFYLDENKNPLYLDGVILDITGIHEVREQLQQAFDEREVLIREVHHRVKNNMQAIIHLIENQMDVVTDEKGKQSLSALKDQAYTMALVYDQLNRTRHLSKIEMRPYLEELALNICSSFQRPDRIMVTIECDDILMEVSQAMPCAMILNELITNAHKYSFPPGTGGEHDLIIRFAETNQEFKLLLRDNGQGIPEDIDKYPTSGLKLVRLWAEHQLGGTMKMYNENGLVIEISFPVKVKGNNHSWFK